MAHKEMKACPNTLGTPSTHAWEQCPCISYHMRQHVHLDWTQQYTIKTLDKRGVLLASVHHTMLAPTAHLELE